MIEFERLFISLALVLMSVALRGSKQTGPLKDAKSRLRSWGFTGLGLSYFIIIIIFFHFFFWMDGLCH